MSFNGAMTPAATGALRDGAGLPRNTSSAATRGDAPSPRPAFALQATAGQASIGLRSTVRSQRRPVSGCSGRFEKAVDAMTLCDRVKPVCAQ
jgi:hypothetical protein